MARPFLVLSLAMGLTACAATYPVGSEAYREGWRFGCWSGYDAAGYNWYWGLAHNKPEYGDDPEWQPAWEQGYRECFDRGISTDPIKERV